MEMERYKARRPLSGSGKIKRRLYRIHTVAPKVGETISESEESSEIFSAVPLTVNSNIIQNFGTVPVKSNIFQNVVITPNALIQTLAKKDEANLKLNQNLKNIRRTSDEFDMLLKRIQSSSKRSEGIPRRRKIPFHELVSSAKEFLEKREKEKKKAKEAILTNFTALEEALPALEQLVEKKNEDDAKPRAAKPFPKQDAEMMEDIQTYQQVLNDAEYVADPIGTITAQLKRRIESGSL